MIYLYAVLAFVLLLALVVAPSALRTYWRWLRDFQGGVVILGIEHNNQDISRKHLLRELMLARKQVDILSGAMHASVWDSEVAKAFEKALRKRPSLKVRILVGPDLYDYTNETHPVFDYYETVKDKLADRWQIRFLKEYPHKDQGRHSDGDLYLELDDSPDQLIRPVVTYYRDYDGYRGDKVTEFLDKFNVLWEGAEGSTKPQSREHVVPLPQGKTNGESAA